MYGNISEFYAKERINSHLKAAEAHRMAKLATNRNNGSFKRGIIQKLTLRATSLVVKTVKNFRVKYSSPYYPKV